jgi:hypothetical protein
LLIIRRRSMKNFLKGLAMTAVMLTVVIGLAACGKEDDGFKLNTDYVAKEIQVVGDLPEGVTQENIDAYSAEIVDKGKIIFDGENAIIYSKNESDEWVVSVSAAPYTVNGDTITISASGSISEDIVLKIDGKKLIIEQTRDNVLIRMIFKR